MQFECKLKRATISYPAKHTAFVAVFEAMALAAPLPLAGERSDYKADKPVVSVGPVGGAAFITPGDDCQEVKLVVKQSTLDVFIVIVTAKWEGLILDEASWAAMGGPLALSVDGDFGEGEP